MADLWDEETDASEFALPGDDQLNGLVQEAEEPAAEDPSDSEAPAEAEAAAAVEAAETPPEATDEAVPLTEDELKLQRVKEKFGDIPDVAARSYMELETELGRLRGELGQARSLAEERLAGIEQRIQQPPSPATVPADFDWDAIAYEDPYRALTIAANTGNREMYETAKAAVEAVHPAIPRMFEHQAAMNSQLTELQQQMQETREPVIRSEKQAVVTNAYKEVAAEYPDFEELAPVMNQIVTEVSTNGGYDWISPELDSGDPARAKAAWRQLALSARGLQGENLADAARVAAREHVAETNRAKQDAVVASASTTVTPAALSAAEKIGAQWEEIDAPFRGADSGWNI